MEQNIISHFSKGHSPKKVKLKNFYAPEYRTSKYVKRSQSSGRLTHLSKIRSNNQKLSRDLEDLSNAVNKLDLYSDLFI